MNAGTALFYISKVNIFWEGYTILRNLQPKFDRYYIDKTPMEILKKFVAFSEYVNFNYIVLRGKKMVDENEMAKPEWIKGSGLE